MSKLTYQPNFQFDFFINQLKKNSSPEWQWLINRFRQRLSSWLYRKIESYPKNALQTRSQFVEEIIEESLIKFFELLPNGVFSQYSDMEAAIVTIAGFKLKEGFRQLKKDQKIYLMEPTDIGVLQEQQIYQAEKIDKQQLELIQEIKEKFRKLETKDQLLLTRYFNGEELQDIANDLSISPAACRKRKQRVIDKLKIFVLNAIKTILF